MHAIWEFWEKEDHMKMNVYGKDVRDKDKIC